MAAHLCGLLVASILSYIAYAWILRVRRGSGLSPGIKRLPGPTGFPFIGSALEIPDKNSSIKFHEWGEQYGPIYQVNIAGSNHVWITRDSIATDLLTRRAAIYSDRPFIPALEQDNRTSGQYLPLMSRNELWTRQRKFAKQIMDTSTKAAFYHYPELESVRLLMDLMTDPGRYNHHLESYIARVTCRLAWGTAAPSDELKQRARELLYGVSPSGSLGNKLAFLMKLPQKWSSVKAWEVRRARTERRFFERMQDSVRSQISRPETLEAPQSWMRQCLEKNASWGFASDLEGAYAVGMHGIAGALTVAAPMQSFCLAICHFPQYQPILHEEIDRVCGDRMPTFSDMESMPILRAFIRETMRWRPPVPTGIPHELIQDDVYEGYHIPAGSIIHPLEWSLGRDPAVFYNPEAFNPLRWLDSSFPTYREPLTKYPTITSYSQFGYGRRTCQGMAVTEADLFVGLGSLAWLFSVSKPGASAEPSTPQEETVAMSIKEQDLSLAHNMPFGLSTPPDENEIAFHFSSDALNRKLSHVDNNKTFVPKSFTAPATPPDSPPRRLSLDTSTATKMKSATKTEPISSRAKSKQEPDPTLEYTSLLIAKPLPFALELKIRNQDRADLVAREWMARKMEGEFEDAECYWEGGNDGNDMFGWSKIPGS